MQFKVKNPVLILDLSPFDEKLNKQGTDDVRNDQ